MGMRMTTATMRRKCRAVRRELGQGRVQRMRRGKGRGKQRKKGRRRGRETVKGKGVANNTQGGMISHVPLLSSCSWKCMRQTRTLSVH
jgi:hypothetical protein